MRILIAALLTIGLTCVPALAQETPEEKRRMAEDLVLQFWKRVWNPPHDLQAVNELVVEDFVITSAGSEIKGPDAFVAWIEAFQEKAKDIRLEVFETFANSNATRVTSRWRAHAVNGGVLGTKPDGRPISFTGIAVWEIRWTEQGPMLAHNWVERSAWELYQQLTAP